MEVYILDDQLRRNTVLDRYESLIWTERYSELGDFQLVIHSTGTSRALLVEETWLAINNSRRVMKIENVENKDDSEGRQLLTVTGRSLEAILADRSVRQNLKGTDTDPNWITAAAPPAALLRNLFNYICVLGSLDPGDIIPMITTGSLYPPNTISEPDQNVIMSLDPKDLYETIKDAAGAYGLGFRLYRGPDDSKLYFDIYTGDDRTSSQSTLPAVIFAPDLENLTNTSEFRSIEKYKNIALVIGKTRTKWVYANDDAKTATGFDRRVLTHTVTDIDLDKYDLTQAQEDLIVAAQAAITVAADKVLVGYLSTNTDMTPAQLTTVKSYTTSGPLTTQQRTDLGVIITYYETYRTNVPAIDAALEQRGQEELTKYKPIKAMDGELPTNAKYRYGIDYELGDLVEMRNDDGLTNRMRVTEQIFVDDAQGERSYPTLALDEFITPGTWYAWDANGVWDTAPGVWAFAGGEVGDDNLLPNGNLEWGSLTSPTGGSSWATFTGATQTVSSAAGDIHSGTRGLNVVTTAANSGVAHGLAGLAESPVGAYAGIVWVKTTSGHTYKAKIQEYTLAGTLIGESAVATGPGTGAWVQHNFTYTKQQSSTVLRISITKDAAGTFSVDDAEIRKIL